MWLEALDEALAGKSWQIQISHRHLGHNEEIVLNTKVRNFYGHGKEEKPVNSFPYNTSIKAEVLLPGFLGNQQWEANNITMLMWHGILISWIRKWSHTQRMPTNPFIPLYFFLPLHQGYNQSW